MKRSFHLLSIAQGDFFGPFKVIMLIIKVAEIKISNTDIVKLELSKLYTILKNKISG